MFYNCSHCLEIMDVSAVVLAHSFPAVSVLQLAPAVPWGSLQQPLLANIRHPI